MSYPALPPPPASASGAEGWEWYEKLDWDTAAAAGPGGAAMPPPPREAFVDPDAASDDADRLTDVNDPLSSRASLEPAEAPPLLLGNSDDDDETEGRDFMAIKPWLGAIYPPSRWKKDPSDHKSTETVFTADNNNWGLPEVNIELDYIFGYRARGCYNNVRWVDDDAIIYHAGAVCVKYKMTEDDQDFYFGHDDDIICLNHHDGKRLACSGSIGSRDTVRLCIWNYDTMTEVQCISGFHRFGVTSCAFNPAGTIVLSIGMDEHHSVALHSVETGELLANAQVDKNNVRLARWNKSNGVDSDSCFVTCGEKHICFWKPLDPHAAKGGKFYFTSPAKLDERLAWQKATKATFIDDRRFGALEFTPRYTIVGADDGSVYCFDSVSQEYVFKFQVGPPSTLKLPNPVQSMERCDDEGAVIAMGSKDGWIRFYDFSKNDRVVEADYFLPQDGKPRVHVNPINVNKVDPATQNDEEAKAVNSIRAMDFNPRTQDMLVGTILSHVYCIDVDQSTRDEPKLRWDKPVISSHWGDLSKPDGYGEIWGVVCHPTKQEIISCSEDATVRRWCIDKNAMLARLDVLYPCTHVDISIDAEMIAVGHTNGSFTVLGSQLKRILWPNTRHRNRSVSCIRFSPCCRYLAVAAGQVVDIYEISVGNPLRTKRGVQFASSKVAQKKGATLETNPERGRIFTRVGTCRGHTSFINGLDWNLSSQVIQSTSTGYELLYHSIPDCRRVTGARALADQHWFTQKCKLGWSVQGIWPKYADGTDINSVTKSFSERLLACTDDYGTVTVFNYPCVGSGLNKFGQLKKRPQCHTLWGHSSHVTNCSFSPKDEYLVTTGGADLCIFIWKLSYTEGEGFRGPPTKFVDADYVNNIRKQIKDAKEARAKRHAARAAARAKAVAEGRVPDPDSDDGDVDVGSPLKTGMVDTNLQKAGIQEETLAQLQERLRHKQRQWKPPARCELCDHLYANELIKACPRCFHPRKLAYGVEERLKPFTKAPGQKFKPKGERVFKDGVRLSAEADARRAEAERLAKEKHRLGDTSAIAKSLKEETGTFGDASEAYVGEVRSRIYQPTKSFACSAKEAMKQRDRFAAEEKLPAFTGGGKGTIPPVHDMSDSDDEDGKTVARHVQILKARQARMNPGGVANAKLLPKKPKKKDAGPRLSGPTFVDL